MEADDDMPAAVQQLCEASGGTSPACSKLYIRALRNRSFTRDESRRNPPQ